MEISDDEANMIAGRIFDAIEAKGLFNRQLVATEIKAGLALVKAPAKRSVRVDLKPGGLNWADVENLYPRLDNIDRRRQLQGDWDREPTTNTVASPSETEDLIVKAMKDLLGMPLSPGKRDPDGTAHYRLPDTRKETPAERAKRELLSRRPRNVEDEPF